jgi:two-component system sensor histidine kinase BaeS
MTWHRYGSPYRRHGPPFRRYGHDVPRFVRRMGCAFGGLILFAAIGGSALVSFFTRAPRSGWAIAIAIAVAVLIVVSFARTFRRAAQVFGEQYQLRRQLMADVAHELRTPLAILQGRIEGLLDGVYPRDDARLAELLAETQHLSRLVEDVRTLANAEAGALDLRKERIDAAELIRDAAAAIGSQVQVDVPGELRIDADPVRIREVLLNLLSNAVQHAPEVTVSVSAEERPRQLVIRVRDNGSGIPAEELPHLFERFRKGSASRGSGLGLSIARKLVLAHGGTIGVESGEGVGTTVTVTLPR